LHLVYPKIEKSYKKTALGLMKDKAIMDHGKKSVRETKKMILTAGIGLALVYDNTPGQNHYYTYLTRILDYLSLGVPVITTKTAGNVHLLGHNYPLFVDDAQDIVRCYLRLMEPDFYREMSDLSKNIGRQFVGEVAVEDFWSILESQMPAGK
ncbi:glycosyltransferase family 1 protein, partial [Bacillus sp. JJ1533]